MVRHQIHHVQSIVAFGKSHHNLSVNFALGRLLLQFQAFAFLHVDVVHTDDQILTPLRSSKDSLHLKPDRHPLHQQTVLKIKNVIILDRFQKRFAINMLRERLFIFGIDDSFHIDLRIRPEISRIGQLQLGMLATECEHGVLIRLVIDKKHALVIKRKCRCNIFKSQLHIHRKAPQSVIQRQYNSLFSE